MQHVRKETAIRRFKGFALVIGAVVGASPAMGDVIYQQDFESWNNSDGLWSSNTIASLGGPYTSVLGRFSATTVSLDILATPDNTAGLGGGDPGSVPFNVTVDQHSENRDRVPELDGGGGGGPGGMIGDIVIDAPNLNLGDTISNGTNPGNDGTPIFGPGTYAIHFDLMLFDSWDGGYGANGPDTFSVGVNGSILFDELLYSSAYGPGLNFRDPDETPSENVYHTRWVDSIYRDIELVIELTEATDLFKIDFIGRPSQSMADESWGLDNILLEQISSLRSAPEVPAPGSMLILTGGIGMIARRRRSVKA